MRVAVASRLRAVRGGVGGGRRGWRSRVEELGALGMAGDDGDAVSVVEGEVGVEEDEEGGDGAREGQGGV